MKNSPLFLILGLSGAGLLSGLAARRMTYSVVRPVLESKPASVREIPVKSAPAPAKPAVPRQQTSDTLESLSALPHGELYSRLAAWLVDACEPEIAACWEDYRKREFIEDFDDIDSIPQLVFINWIRVDRSAAMATAAGTLDEGYAWAAWACHDPQGALTAALAAGPEHVRSVASGLGEFRPAWLRQHFNTIPEDARKWAFVGLSGTGDAQNPLEMLKFAREHGIDSEDSTFKALVNKDPWAALDWAKENRTGLDTLVSQMAEERPDDLVRLAAQSPSGEAKRMMEAALFANLIKTDPGEALAQAKAAEVPRVVAERCAAVGLALVKADPEQAFEMVGRLLAAYPDATGERNLIQIPTGQLSAQSTSVEGVDKLLDALLFHDPARLMDIIVANSPVVPVEYDTFREFSSLWQRRDVTAYVEWMKRQTDPSDLPEEEKLNLESDSPQ